MPIVRKRCSTVPPKLPAASRNHCVIGLGIGTNQLNDVVRAAFHQALPFFGNGPTHQWNIGQPRRRWRHTGSRCHLRQINKTAGVSSDRTDGHRKRNQHEKQQKQRHQRNGGPATPAESRLQSFHEGPCGNHQRGRPHGRRQEGPHNKKRNDDQADNRQDGERRARQVERFRYHRTLQRWNARSRRATERARVPNTNSGNVVFSSRSRPSAVAGRGPLFVLQRGVAIMANSLSVVRRRSRDSLYCLHRQRRDQAGKQDTGKSDYDGE